MSRLPVRQQMLFALKLHVCRSCLGLPVRARQCLRWALVLVQVGYIKLARLCMLTVSVWGRAVSYFVGFVRLLLSAWGVLRVHLSPSGAFWGAAAA